MTDRTLAKFKHRIIKIFVPISTYSANHVIGIYEFMYLWNEQSSLAYIKHTSTNKRRMRRS